ncbi:unnamed protein product, partial [Prorocentrum cordatum]
DGAAYGGGCAAPYQQGYQQAGYPMQQGFQVMQPNSGCQMPMVPQQGGFQAPQMGGYQQYGGVQQQPMQQPMQQSNGMPWGLDGLARDLTQAATTALVVQSGVPSCPDCVCAPTLNCPPLTCSCPVGEGQVSPTAAEGYSAAELAVVASVCLLLGAAAGAAGALGAARPWARPPAWMPGSSPAPAPPAPPVAAPAVATPVAAAAPALAAQPIEDVQALAAAQARAFRSFFLTRYNVGGVAVYHERLLLYATGYVLTPDMDDYGESVAPGADILSVHQIAGQGGRVGGIAEAQTYRFRRLPTQAELWAALRLGAAAGFGGLPASPFGLDLSAANCGGQPAGPMEVADPHGALAPAPPAGGALVGAVGPPPAAPAAAPGAAAAPPAAAVAAGPAVPGEAAAAAPGRAPAVPDTVPVAPLPTGAAAPGWVWVAAEDVDGLVAFGEALEVGVAGGVILAGRVGRWGLFTLPTGGGASGVLLQENEVAYFKREYRGNDARTLELPAASVAASEAARDWREVVQLCHKEDIANFAVPGPRTAAWCARYQVKEGGPCLHYDMWKSRRKLTSTDYGVDMHETLSRMVEAMGASDHLDVFNLASAEICHRKLQLIEHYWDDRGAEQQQNNSKIPLEESQAFMGGARAPSMARPELLETVSKELERISSIKKNARKLREEQAAAAKGLVDGDGRVQRSLLPLPVSAWCGAPGGPSRPRSARRRRGHRAQQGELLAELVVALNQLDAGSDLARRQCEGEPSRMQQLCLERLAESCAAMGAPPSDLSIEVALWELQVGAAYGGCDPVTAAPFVHDLVSLPAVGGAPVPLDQLLGKGGPEIARRFISTKDYLAFARRMGGANMLDSRLDGDDFEEVGLFTVWKKDGRQRLVIDCRGSNLHFAELSKTGLASGASFSAIELQEGEQLWTGGVDIADAFYNVGLPSDLRRFFALPRLRAGDLGLESVEGQRVLSRAWVRPCLAVLPMGWSHALDFCQRVHRAIVLGKGGPPGTAEIADGRPPAEVSEGAFAAYVDNFVAYGTGPERPADMLDAARKAAEGAGPPVHPTEPPATVSEQLGWVFDGERGALRPKSRRVWRLRLGLLELLKKGYATGRQVGKVAGHYAFIVLAQRLMLSVFNAVYSFSRKYFSR